MEPLTPLRSYFVTLCSSEATINVYKNIGAKRLTIASGRWGFIVLQPCYLRYPIIVSDIIVQIKNKPYSYLSTCSLH